MISTPTSRRRDPRRSARRLLDPAATAPLQDYVPRTRELLPLGQLHLNNRELKLDSLDGAMELEFAGIMPDSAGPDMAGSSVYRVTNAEEFFRKNADNERVLRPHASLDRRQQSDRRTRLERRNLAGHADAGGLGRLRSRLGPGMPRRRLRSDLGLGRPILFIRLFRLQARAHGCI